MSVKTIMVDDRTHDRFMSHKKGTETKEELFNRILDEYEDHLKCSECGER